MLGAIVGDVIGSRFEFNNLKSKDFDLFNEDSKFTDDTVLTVALAESILNEETYCDHLVKYALKYPHAGYGGRFVDWIHASTKQPYNSWGNGSAMRVSPVAWAYEDEATVLEKAKESAEWTHSHPQGVRGAQAVALAIFMARKGSSKDYIKNKIEELFDYDLSEHTDSIRNWYTFKVSCKSTVPPAIRAFYDSEDFEDAIRIAISLGGDSDTIAAITGSIAEAYYGKIPEEILLESLLRLDEDMLKVVKAFRDKYFPND